MNYREIISNIAKGVGMGAANVIPGVSGGTIALITGIFERLINSIKSFNLTAIKLLFTGQFKKFAKHTDFQFLLSVIIGIVIAILSVAVLFKYLFNHYPIYIWSFFFGLILASIFYVGATVNKWNVPTIIAFIAGAAIAILISMGTPAQQNNNFFYLILCGAVGTCSMILPGLSGSFILILMGNYQLVMIDSINMLTSQPIEAFKILLPVVIGAAIGLIGFSHLLSWVYKRFRDQTISLLTGFILGSTPIIWPWKENVTQLFGNTEKVIGYKWLLPSLDFEFLIALICIVAGAAVIIITENAAKNKKTK